LPYSTEQEEFWAGEFGAEYITRNNAASLVASNINLFSCALRATEPIRSCLEFGANIGLNLKALRMLFPALSCSAIEINQTASALIKEQIANCRLVGESILDYVPSRKFDLVLSKGVLIHIDPNYLPVVYEKLVRSSAKYILIIEYYNPTPVAISYRGHEGRLFKRDFAGEMLQAYSSLNLKDYGFCYHRDPKFPQDDLNWFLLEKKF